MESPGYAPGSERLYMRRLYHSSLKEHFSYKGRVAFFARGKPWKKSRGVQQLRCAFGCSQLRRGKGRYGQGA